MQKTLMDLSALDFSRVAIIGCPGSGKTTFSNRLGKALCRSVFHLDKLLWEKNWKMIDYEKRVEIHKDLINQENWIIDGMWRSHLPDRMNRASLVIFLDYKRSLCLRRAISRRIKFAGKQREDIADGCLEKLDRDFLRYIWHFRKEVRPLIYKLFSQHPEVQTVVLKNPKLTAMFEKQLVEFVKNAL